MTPANARCRHRTYAAGVCNAPVRAVIGFREPDVAYVGVEPYIYAATLYEAATHRRHVHQGYAVWVHADGQGERRDLGFASERYRLYGRRLEERRERAQEWTRRPPESYVIAPRPYPRTEQRRLA
jgi:hypothetical protein